MIVWSGKGLIVPLVAFVFGALGTGIGGGIGKSVATLGEAGTPFGMAIGLILSGIALTFVWKWLRNEDRVLVDPKTNQRIVYQDGSSLFFIPVAAWSYILIGIGTIFLAALLGGWRPEPSRPRVPRPAQTQPAPAPSPVPPRAPATAGDKL